MQTPFHTLLLVEVVAAIIVHPIIAALNNVAKRLGHGDGNGQDTISPPLWDTSKVLGYVALMLALSATVFISLGVTSALHGARSMTGWNLSFTFISWIIYLSVATAFGYISLQILSVMTTELALEKPRRRNQIFVLSVLTKLGGLLLFACWAIMPGSTSLATIVSTSYLIFIGIDAAAFIFIMLVD